VSAAALAARLPSAWGELSNALGQKAEQAVCAPRAGTGNPTGSSKNAWPHTKDGGDTADSGEHAESTPISIVLAKTTVKVSPNVVGFGCRCSGFGISIQTLHQDLVAVPPKPETRNPEHPEVHILAFWSGLVLVSSVSPGLRQCVCERWTFGYPQAPTAPCARWGPGHGEGSSAHLSLAHCGLRHVLPCTLAYSGVR
jgi:hypothetical protein